MGNGSFCVIYQKTMDTLPFAAHGNWLQTRTVLRSGMQSWLGAEQVSSNFSRSTALRCCYAILMKGTLTRQSAWKGLPTKTNPSLQQTVSTNWGRITSRSVVPG